MIGRALALATCWSLVVACQQTPEPAAREIHVQPLLKPSCRIMCGSTCLACVDSLLAFATDAEGASLVDAQCQNVRGRWETMCDLTLGSEITVLSNVPTSKPVVVQLFAYRNTDAPLPDAGVDGGPQCVAPPMDNAWSCHDDTNDLILWGRSRPTSLAPDGGATRIEIELECRAGCDCLDLGRRPTCPLELRSSACIAGAGGDTPLNCLTSCSSDQECFEGSLRCDVDAGRCQPVIANPTQPLPFCARCQHSSECADQLCVGRRSETEDGGYGYCSRSCPDYSCPRGASCTPVDELSQLRALQ
jgi:hypothetical protein